MWLLTLSFNADFSTPYTWAAHQSPIPQWTALIAFSRTGSNSIPLVSCCSTSVKKDFFFTKTGLPHVREKSRKKQNFHQVRELSGNFEKMSGNFVHLTNVRELSGNFVITINLFPKMSSFGGVLFSQILKFLLDLFLSACNSHHTFFKNASLLL